MTETTGLASVARSGGRGAPFTIDELHVAHLRGWRPTDTARVLAARLAEADDPATWIGGVDLVGFEHRAERLEASGASPEELPLYGVPFAVKDNIDVAGVPTTAGCPDYAYVPDRSARAVELLEQAGALYVGKTNLDQFATGLTGARSPHGTPRNPRFPSLVPGGSSSGSAAAVAAGVVPISLGTDTAGSGRVPAALTGILGLKPTPGLVSTAGVVPACRSLDCTTVFATSVDDLARVFEVLDSFDRGDTYARPPGPDREPQRWAGPPRIGVPSAAGLADVEASVRTGLAHAVERLAGRDRVSAVDMAPFFEVGDLLYDGAWLSERTAAVGDFIEGHPESVVGVVADIILGGRSATAVDAFRGQYRLRELRARLAGTWDDVDLLVVPSTPRRATLAEVAAAPRGVNTELGRFSTFANLLGLCALTVPAGVDPDGLPVSVTLLATAGHDRDLLALAARAPLT